MKITDKQIKAVISLSADKRYSHFIKVVCDSEIVWGLNNDGWAMATTNDEQEIFPLWPAKEYAEICAKDEWSGYAPESFSINELIDDLLPNLKNDCVLPGVFYTPKDKGVIVTVDELLANINKELEKY